MTALLVLALTRCHNCEVHSLFFLLWESDRECNSHRDNRVVWCQIESDPSLHPGGAEAHPVSFRRASRYRSHIVFYHILLLIFHVLAILDIGRLIIGMSYISLECFLFVWRTYSLYFGVSPLALLKTQQTLLMERVERPQWSRVHTYDYVEVQGIPLERCLTRMFRVSPSLAEETIVAIIEHPRINDGVLKDEHDECPIPSDDLVRYALFPGKFHVGKKVAKNIHMCIHWMTPHRFEIGSSRSCQFHYSSSSAPTGQAGSFADEERLNLSLLPMNELEWPSEIMKDSLFVFQDSFFSRVPVQMKSLVTCRRQPD